MCEQCTVSSVVGLMFCADVAKRMGAENTIKGMANFIESRPAIHQMANEVKGDDASTAIAMYLSWAIGKELVDLNEMDRLTLFGNDWRNSYTLADHVARRKAIGAHPFFATLKEMSTDEQMGWIEEWAESEAPYVLLNRSFDGERDELMEKLDQPTLDWLSNHGSLPTDMIKGMFGITDTVEAIHKAIELSQMPTSSPVGFGPSSNGVLAVGPLPKEIQ